MTIILQKKKELFPGINNYLQKTQGVEALTLNPLLDGKFTRNVSCPSFSFTKFSNLLANICSVGRKAFLEMKHEKASRVCLFSIDEKNSLGISPLDRFRSEAYSCTVNSLESDVFIHVTYEMFLHKVACVLRRKVNADSVCSRNSFWSPVSTYRNHLFKCFTFS